METLGQLGGDQRVVLDRLGEVSAPRGPGADRLHHQRVGVTHEHDPEAVVEVDVLVAIDVPDPAALPVVDEHRLGRRVLE